ncbi:MAG: TIGR00730 family Rossman fold protein [Candidatus Paceibacterota bacterium]|jgi:hypothetical protein
METDQLIQSKIAEMNKEFAEGLNFIKNYQKSVTFYGSARTHEDDHHYKLAFELAKKVVQELGYAVVTGGGPGIMEAANKGAYEMGGDSIGATIKLPKEQNNNPYLTASHSFNNFSIRKTILSFMSEAYVFSPGGFGTMDELFEVLTLIQTGKFPKVPVFLLGKDYWSPLSKGFIKKHMLEDSDINKEDMYIYHITDDLDEIIQKIKRAPVRTV